MTEGKQRFLNQAKLEAYNEFHASLESEVNELRSKLKSLYIEKYKEDIKSEFEWVLKNDDSNAKEKDEILTEQNQEIAKIEALLKQKCNELQLLEKHVKPGWVKEDK